MKKDKIKIVLREGILVFSSLIIGILIATFLKTSSCKDDGIISRVTKKDKFEPLYEAYNEIKEKYYDKVNDQTLIDGALNGMMESLGDKHTMYFDKESKEAFNLELSGSYFGIGAEIHQNQDKTISIKKVFDESPAAKVGLKANDQILSIDGESTEGKTATEVANAIKKGKNIVVELEIKRDNKNKKYKITKENVTLYSVSSDMLEVDNKKIGYVDISIFGEKTYYQFVNAVEKLENNGMESLIIDLRGNSGGYLSTVTNMLNIFIPSGNVIYKMQTHDGVEEFKSTSSNSKDYKIVILVDKDSASASEIMSAAMKEVYGAKLVGTKTYGKGTVQSTSDLSNGAMIKYTIQRWLTPSGKCIDGEGIEPDVQVELDEDYITAPSNETDNQLQKAIELLK